MYKANVEKLNGELSNQIVYSDEIEEGITVKAEDWTIIVGTKAEDVVDRDEKVSVKEMNEKLKKQVDCKELTLLLMKKIIMNKEKNPTAKKIYDELKKATPTAK